MDASVFSINNFHSSKRILNYMLIKYCIQEKLVSYRNQSTDMQVSIGFYVIQFLTRVILKHTIKALKEVNELIITWQLHFIKNTKCCMLLIRIGCKTPIEILTKKHIGNLLMNYIQER